MSLKNMVSPAADADTPRTESSKQQQLHVKHGLILRKRVGDPGAMTNA